MLRGNMVNGSQSSGRFCRSGDRNQRWSLASRSYTAALIEKSVMNDAEVKC